MLYLDLKVTDFGPIVGVVRKAAFSKSAFYRVYRPGDVDRLRQLDPSSQVIVAIDQLGLLPGAADLVLEKHPEVILSLDLSAWTGRLQGKSKWPSSRWFVNVLGRQASASELRRAISLRPTGIMTDSPRMLLDLLR